MPHILLYLIALLSLSTSASWAKLNQMPSEVLGFWRLIIAGVLLSLWVFGVKKTQLPKFEKKIFWVILTGTFFFGHLWSYKFASKNTSIANTMILFATAPVWSTIGSIVFFGEKLTLRVVIAYILASCGVITLVYNQIHFQQTIVNGDVSALVSALFYALFMLAGKKARNDYSNLVFSSVQYLICAFLFLIASIACKDNFFGYSDISWFAVAGQVLIPTFLGHFLFTHLVKTMNLSLMTCGKLIEPIFGAIIAYFLFKENLHTESYIAFALTASSLIILFAPNVFKTKTVSPTEKT